MCLQYRTRKNYRNKDFLGPRIADKLAFSLLMTWWAFNLSGTAGSCAITPSAPDPATLAMVPEGGSSSWVQPLLGCRQELRSR